MDEEILKLLGRAGYVPANVPELLRLLRWPPNRQQELQKVLRGLERSGRITRTKGNRYIQSREADLVPGRIRINRQGKGFLIPDDPKLKEISPLDHAADAGIPILLIHGRDDTVVPFSQSDDMADALKNAKKQVTFVELSGEDHWLSRAETRLKMLTETVNFLEANNPPN